MNGLDGSDGTSFDTKALVVNVPGGVGSTTVQLFSEPVNQNPDTLLWEVAALRVPMEAAPPPDMGCGPGHWKNHTDAWSASGFSPSQTVGSVFSGASAYPSLASQTLLQALQGGGGNGAIGGARILLRAAVAAVINGSHPDVSYPRTLAEILADVNCGADEREPGDHAEPGGAARFGQRSRWFVLSLRADS